MVSLLLITGSLWEMPVHKKKSRYTTEKNAEVLVLVNGEYRPTSSTDSYRCVLSLMEAYHNKMIQE